jgi:2-(1,2-epoxy-1,2-dihydrophenyl)acetyl-CoA isomerase
MATALETGTNDLLGRIEDRVAVLTFNRPDRRNALSSEMYDGFNTALQAIKTDDAIRVVMVTGAGGAFCAGGDVKAMNKSHVSGEGHRATMDADEAVADLQRRQRDVSLALHNFPKPVVAALPGAAAGAGMSIALAADLRVAAPKALLVTAFANVGASGDFGGSWFMNRLVGESKAKELYFRSPRLTADQAYDLGLVNAVLDDEDFEAAALRWCADIANQAPLAITRMKENLNRASDVDLGTALDAEAVNMIFTMSTADHREAAAAFVEKRTPTFKGE